MRQVLPMLTFLTLLTLLSFPAYEVGATTWHVPGDAPSIQAGIDLADYGDTVLVACGSYSEHDIVIKSGTMLISETGEADCVTIDAQGLGTVMIGYDLDDSTVITGFTLTGGDAGQFSGGGIRLEGSSPRISHCRISGNTAPGAGGCACANSSPSFVDCVFSGNTAITGGALHCGASTLVLDRCEISDNTATDWHGGGVFIAYSSATMIDCHVSGNSTSNFGGGIAITNSQFELRGSSVTANMAKWGGGIVCERSDVMIIDSILRENTAVEGGGGIQLGTDTYQSGSFEARHSTIRDNEALFGADGYNATYEFYGVLVCCDIVPGGWLGYWGVDDDDCDTATASSSMSAIKALYR